jgi:xanthine permease XanP
MPEILKHFPEIVKSIFGSPITTGGISAILLNIILPRSYKEQQVHENLQTDIT